MVNVIVFTIKLKSLKIRYVDRKKTYKSVHSIVPKQ